jgi:hypothetical protein
VLRRRVKTGGLQARAKIARGFLHCAFINLQNIMPIGDIAHLKTELREPSPSCAEIGQPHKDLRVPDADKGLPVLEKAGDSGDWGFSGPALTKAVGQYCAV